MKIFESPTYPDGQLVMVGDEIKNNDFGDTTFLVLSIEGPDDPDNPKMTLQVLGEPNKKGPGCLCKNDYLVKRK